MKDLGRSGWALVVLFFYLPLTINAVAQARINASHVEPNLPVRGTLATTQAMAWPASVIADGSGGFYTASSTQNRVYRVALDGRLSVAAGSGLGGYGGDGGPATSAQLNGPCGVAVDAGGNLYIADTWNNRIRKVTPPGTISTIAGDGTVGFGGDGGPATSAQLASPYDVTVDAGGNLYITDTWNNRIRKVTPSGTISTVAGNGTEGYSGDGGPATSAQLNHPYGVTVDAGGNLYIADTDNNRIRKVTPPGTMSTVAGDGTWGYSGDGGPATSAQLASPYGVTVDTGGNLYVVDADNNRIRKVTPSGTISTVAGDGTVGFGGDSGPAISAQLNHPYGVAVDFGGDLYIADTFNYRIRKVTPLGTISTVAGNGGLANSAQLDSPYGVAVDAGGNLYIADTRNHRIRKVTPSGMINTVAGNGTKGYGGDGDPATSAQLDGPCGVAVDAGGNLYIADTDNSRIRKVTPSGTISTVAGNGTEGYSGDDGPATSAELASPYGIAVDTDGNLYVTDTWNNRIRKVTPSGTISTVAGNGTEGYGGDGGPATSAQLSGPRGVAVDAGGNLYIADTDNNRIRKVTPSGTISTVAGNGIEGYSGDTGPATSVQLNDPCGVAVDAGGNLYIADTDNNRIRKVTPSGTISTVAGNGTEGYGGDAGPATSAQLASLYGVTVDAGGNLFIADTDNNRIRKVTRSGTISTVAGSGVVGYSGNGVPATSAQLAFTQGAAVDAGRNR